MGKFFSPRGIYFKHATGNIYLKLARVTVGFPSRIEENVSYTRSRNPSSGNCCDKLASERSKFSTLNIPRKLGPSPAVTLSLLPKNKETILEGEVINTPAPRKSARSKFSAKLNPLKKLKLNCGLGCLSFLIPITLAIVYKNGLLVLLAFLLPLWFFSRK